MRNSVLALLVFLSTNMFGQLNIESFNFGITNSLVSGPHEKYKDLYVLASNKLGPGFNLGISVPVVDFLILSPEIGCGYTYEKKDTELSGKEAYKKTTNFTSKFNINFDIIPFPSVNNFFSLKAGSSCHWISSHYTQQVADSENTYEEFEYTYKRMGIGPTIGGAIRFLRRESFSLQFQYLLLSSFYTSFKKNSLSRLEGDIHEFSLILSFI